MSGCPVPVGTIVAFCGQRSSLTSSSNWKLCDGTGVSTSAYQQLYAMIGKDNGGDDNNFNLPDLRGRFLRGAGRKYRAGQSHDPKTAPPKTGSFFATITQAPKRDSYHNAAAGGTQMMDVLDGSQTRMMVDSGEGDTRPANMYMDFIIKVFGNVNDQEGAWEADLPVGSIFPFTGPDNTEPEGIDNQFVICDGDVLMTSKFPQLNPVTAGRFGEFHNDNVSRSPDLQGLFIRGVELDWSTYRDPDRLSRSPAPDGSQSGVGTRQDWDTHLQNAYTIFDSLNANSTSSSGCVSYAGWRGLKNADWTNQCSMVGGDEETRPMNYALRYYVNAIGPSENDKPDIPIGGIIAIPGNPDVRNSMVSQDFTYHYLLCDGSDHSCEDYIRLYSLYGSNANIWGQSNGQTFKVPDLRDNYIRGRANGVKTGTWQDWATGQPRNWNNKIAAYPTATHDVMAGFGNKIYENMGQGTQQVRWDGMDADETAPASLAVNFYVRAR